jgi:hypothetical protein
MNSQLTGSVPVRSIPDPFQAYCQFLECLTPLQREGYEMSDNLACDEA